MIVMSCVDSSKILKPSLDKIVGNIKIKDVDCIIFDCDGVLVDVSDSYYATIRETVSFVLRAMMPSVLFDKDDLVNHTIIEKFKDAGRFNDEIDLSCAIILCAIIAAKTSNADDNATCGATGSVANHIADNHIADNHIIDNDTSNIIPNYNHIIDDVISNSAHGGINSVISYALNVADVSDAIAYMEHPSDNRDGKLCQIFDQIFFGPVLYKKIRKRDSEINVDPMIDRDHVIMTPRTLRMLHEQFNGNVAMVTGRGIDSARYTLGSLFEIFDVENSAFLEDESRVYAKPNPTKLAECMQGMGCKNAIYVGDSIEDAIMSQMLSNAKHNDKDVQDDVYLDKNVVFCGIIGTSNNPEKRREILLQKGASMILDSVLEFQRH